MRDAPAAREQGPDVAARLGVMQLAERPAHRWDLEILADIRRDHKKQAGVGSALVQLAGGVEVARANTECRGATKFLAPDSAQVLQLHEDLRRGRDVSENGDVVPRPRPLSELPRHQRW